MSLPRFGVTKPVPVNLLMIAMLLAGLVGGLTLRRQFFPEIAPEAARKIGGVHPGIIRQAMQQRCQNHLARAHRGMDRERRERAAQEVSEWAEACGVRSARERVRAMAAPASEPEIEETTDPELRVVLRVLAAPDDTPVRGLRVEELEDPLDARTRGRELARLASGERLCRPGCGDNEHQQPGTESGQAWEQAIHRQPLG